MNLPGKICSRCRLYLPLDKFCIDRGKTDGHRSACRECERESRKGKAFRDNLVAHVESGLTGPETIEQSTPDALLRRAREYAMERWERERVHEERVVLPMMRRWMSRIWHTVFPW